MGIGDEKREGWRTSMTLDRQKRIFHAKNKRKEKGK